MSGGSCGWPLSGHQSDASLEDGTLARWLMPSPRPMCSAPPLRPRPSLCKPPVPVPTPDVAYLFNSCRSPRRGLTDADYADAASTLDVEVAVIQAVAEVETKGEPFDAQGRPRILYERHYFHRLTAGQYRRTHPELSNPVDGGYGKFSAQYGKLEKAYGLNAVAALKSASWGRFQIMGDNHQAAGYPTVQHMVDAMARTEREHLLAFVRFVKSHPGMVKALKNKQWAKFARAYNGPKYAKNAYDTQMAAAYERLTAAAARAAQQHPAAAPLHAAPHAPITPQGPGLPQRLP